MNRLLEKAFSRRGLSPADVSHVEDVEAGDLADVGRFAGILKDAHDEGRRVVVFPDFDCDGVMSAVIGFAGLAELGFNVGLYVPDPRLGYGLSAADFERARAADPAMAVAVTCDVGIDCHGFCDAARSAGVTVVVTDHHTEPDLAHRVGADCVVDPMRADEDYPFPSICGAFVLWKCLMAYAEAFGSKRDVEQIERLRVFAGIGTVTDAMPLLSENRGLVRDAVSICRLVWGEGNDFFCPAVEGSEPYRRAFSGLRCVLDEFASLGKISEDRPIEESFFGFYLGPAVNALRRVGHSVDAAYLSFLSDNPRPYVRSLIEANDRRKRMQAEEVERLGARDQPRAPWFWETDAPGTVRGLLANDVLGKTGLPAIVCAKNADGSWSGSGRSPAYYPALTQLGEVGGFWVRGHQGAFGIRLDDDAQVDLLVGWLSSTAPHLAEVAREKSAEVAPYDYLISDCADEAADVDVDIPLFFEFATEIERYRPFGQAFPEPIGWLEFSPDAASLRTISRGRHLKASLDRGMDVLVWGAGGQLDELAGSPRVRVEGKLRISHFGGDTSIVFEGRRAWSA